LISPASPFSLRISTNLTPEDESDIVALYSSHVIFMCQLSLQSKQKEYPHSLQTAGCSVPGTPLQIPSQPAIGQKAFVLSTAISVEN